MRRRGSARGPDDRSEGAQRLLQHLHGEAFIAAVGTHLGHEEHVLAVPLQRVPKPDLRFAAMVLPAVVEESHAAIECLVHDAHGHLLVFRITKVVAAESKRGDLYARAPKLA